MATSERPKSSNDELEARLEELEKLEAEYWKLAMAGLGKGLIFSFGGFIMIIALVVIALLAIIRTGIALLTGNHLVAIIGILFAFLLLYFAFVFGRVAKIRAEISKTKKQIEVEAGESVF